MANMNSFVADELAYKVKTLHIALNQANNIIETLKIENQRLTDVLINLTSLNKEDYGYSHEIMNESIVAI
jgi:DNA integrity scanning protein DisA with diadenylate cyclase activity